MTSPSIYINFTFPLIPNPSTSPTLPSPVATTKPDTAPTCTVAVTETFHPGSSSPPAVLSPAQPSAPKPTNRYRRHTTSSKPYIRLPTSLDTTSPTSPDPSPNPDVLDLKPARTRHQTAPTTSCSLDPLLVELLDHLTALYRSVWRDIRAGFTLAEALEHYHLTSDMWSARRLIAETWITFREVYQRNLQILTTLCGALPRGLTMEILTQAALRTLHHCTRKQKLREQRRAGILMSM